MIDHINNIVVPSVNWVREDLQLAHDHAALTIYDVFKGQVTDAVTHLLEASNISVVRVPANCTDHLLPMHISLNKAVNDFLRHEFQVWYLEKVSAQLDKNPEGDLSQLA